MSYTHSYTDGPTLKRRADKAEAAIRRACQKAGTLPEKLGIVVRGSSGTTFGSILAYKLDATLLIVRKDGDNRHARERVSGNALDVDKWIWVDDFLSSGSTWNACASEMASWALQSDLYEAIQTYRDSFLGVYLYNGEHYESSSYDEESDLDLLNRYESQTLLKVTKEQLLHRQNEE